MFGVFTLKMCKKLLGENHPNTKRVYNNFVDFLKDIVKANRVDELSDNPMTQDYLHLAKFG